jgi:hypothetical protein
LLWVSPPGDYAIVNSNHIPDGTAQPDAHLDNEQGYDRDKELRRWCCCFRSPALKGPLLAFIDTLRYVPPGMSNTRRFAAPWAPAGERRKRSFKPTGSDGRTLGFVCCFSDKLQAIKFASRVRNESGAEAMISVSGVWMWLATDHTDMQQRLGSAT